MSEQQQDAISAAKDLTGALGDIGKKLNRLNAYGHRSRRLIWLTIISLILDILLTVVVTVSLVQARHAAATASELRATNVAACQGANHSRAAEIRLWSHVIQISPAPKGSAAAIRHEIQVRTTFIAYVRKSFALRDCQRLYRLP